MGGKPVILGLLLSFGLLAGVCFGKYSGGTGEPNDPYLIATPNDLNSIGLDPCDWDKHFKMIADINVVNIADDSFNIIGSYSDRFTGVFEGNGKSIFNFSYTTTGSNYIGLFGYLGTNGEIKNLGLVGVNINVSTGERAGGLVAENNGGTISTCYVQGNVSGDDYVGGLVGMIMNWNGTIEDCYSTGSVSGNGWIGGLIGSGGGTIINCHSTAIVNGGYTVGGLMGLGGHADISNCYSTGTVSGTNNVGGLIGVLVEGILSNCYAIGNVTGTSNRIGGLVGGDWGSVSNCYATGSVTGNDEVGGLVGATDRIVHNSYSKGSVTGVSNVGAFMGAMYWGNQGRCFWNSDVNPSLSGIGNTTDPNVIGLPTEQMQMRDTYNDVGWDMINIWDIGENQTYPFLRTHLPGDINKDDETNFYDLAIVAENWLKEE